MTDSETTAFEDALIADMRAHGGAVTTGPMTGHPLLIMTSTGARSGRSRRAILTWSRDSGDYVVAGTASGSRDDPAWLHNVRSSPDVTVEAEGRPPFEARASVVDDDVERERLWQQHVDALPQFAAYPEQVRRVIPMVRLTPKAPA
jgi:deazaflavin-dependent oxidoreductase (nitroreductase family)